MLQYLLLIDHIFPNSIQRNIKQSYATLYANESQLILFEKISQKCTQ